MSEITKPLVLDETVKELVQAVKEISGNYDLSDYRSIVSAIRSGNANKIPNGSEFTVPHAVYGDITFVTRRQNVDKVAGDADRPTITIQSKYVLSVNAGSTASTFQYDRPEAFAKVAETIPAGTVCKFTAIAYGGWTAGVYHFTATNAIPAGSLLAINGYQNTALTSLKVNVYASAKATTASASYDIVSGDGGATVDLGTWGTNCNHPQRISYGSNNEAQSNIFQWLNGDSGDSAMDSIFTPQTDYDLMCTSFTTLKGFLGGFPDGFRECLGLCAIHNVTNSVYEESPYAIDDEYTHNGYFWLPSRKEIYGSNETSKEESEVQFPYYANLGTENADKLGYAKGATSPTSEWLRTPDSSNADFVRITYAGSGGALDHYGALNSYGVRPLAILA